MPLGFLLWSLGLEAAVDAGSRLGRPTSAQTPPTGLRTGSPAAFLAPSGLRYKHQDALSG